MVINIGRCLLNGSTGRRSVARISAGITITDISLNICTVFKLCTYCTPVTTSTNLIAWFMMVGHVTSLKNGSQFHSQIHSSDQLDAERNNCNIMSIVKSRMSLNWNSLYLYHAYRVLATVSTMNWIVLSTWSRMGGSLSAITTDFVGPND